MVSPFGEEPKNKSIGEALMAVLTTFQIEFIRLLAQTELRESFFLTGGTALSEFYLQHRYSEDLDFFTEEEPQVLKVLPILESMASTLGAELRVKRSFRTFLESALIRSHETLNCDFAWDSPYRLQQKRFDNTYGIFVDNLLDIACNKLSALYDRYNLKDFVDIYFIDREFMPFEQLLERAKQKHIGMDDYSVAVSLSKIVELEEMPRMIKPVSIGELRTFFLEKADWLMSRPA